MPPSTTFARGQELSGTAMMLLTESDKFAIMISMGGQLRLIEMCPLAHRRGAHSAR
jgi:hypothetical protein